MKPLFRWWRKRQRSIDLEILWPSFRKVASSIEEARGAFYCHCMSDSAWTSDFTEYQIIRFCEELS